MKRVIVTADDFGISPAVNEAVERAHRQGILGAASLMVAGAAAADAVQRARAMPTLRVGLHLVLVEGRAVLPHAAIPDLVDRDGWFDANQWGRGFAYFFRPAVRRQLAAEIAAQFAAYAATGLPLDHADAHKHMHLHPTVARLMIAIGRRHGLRAIRVPAEPPSVLAACGSAPDLGARALYRWSRVLRWQARRADLAVADQVFGIAWSGAVNAMHLRQLAAHLPGGVSELYLHPSCAQPEAELAALLDPRVAAAFREAGAAFSAYGELAASAG